MTASAGTPSALQFALRHGPRCIALALVVPTLYAPRFDGSGIAISTRELRRAEALL